MNVGQANYNRKLNWIGTGSSATKGYQWDVKLDHSLQPERSQQRRSSRASRAVLSGTECVRQHLQPDRARARR